MNTATMLLAIALGSCWGYLACMRFEGVGGAPFVGRKSNEGLKSKQEVAERTISRGSIELQESYLESLPFWKHTSEFVEQELKKTKEAIKKFREVKSA